MKRKAPEDDPSDGDAKRLKYDYDQEELEIMNALWKLQIYSLKEIHALAKYRTEMSPGDTPSSMLEQQNSLVTELLSFKDELTVNQQNIIDEHKRLYPEFHQNRVGHEQEEAAADAPTDEGAPAQDEGAPAQNDPVGQRRIERYGHEESESFHEGQRAFQEYERQLWEAHVARQKRQKMLDCVKYSLGIETNLTPEEQGECEEDISGTNRYTLITRDADAMLDGSVYHIHNPGEIEVDELDHESFCTNAPDNDVVLDGDVLMRSEILFPEGEVINDFLPNGTEVFLRNLHIPAEGGETRYGVIERNIVEEQYPFGAGPYLIGPNLPEHAHNAGGDFPLVEEGGAAPLDSAGMAPFGGDL